MGSACFGWINACFGGNRIHPKTLLGSATRSQLKGTNKNRNYARTQQTAHAIRLELAVQSKTKPASALLAYTKIDRNEALWPYVSRLLARTCLVLCPQENAQRRIRESNDANTMHALNNSRPALTANGGPYGEKCFYTEFKKGGTVLIP